MKYDIQFEFPAHLYSFGNRSETSVHNLHLYQAPGVRYVLIPNAGTDWQHLGSKIQQVTWELAAGVDNSLKKEN